MKKIVLLIVLLFGLHRVISDGTIGIGVFTASAQQMANEFDEDDYGNYGGEGSSINGGELPNTDVWGHQPDNYNDIWGTISAIQDWLDSLNNPNNSDDEGTNNEGNSSDSSETSLNSSNDDNGANNGEGFKKRHLPDTNEIDLKFWDKNYCLPEYWHRQFGLMDCFSTIMEYISNYYKGTLFENYSFDRIDFEEIFFNKYGYDAGDDGLRPEDIGKYLQLMSFFWNSIDQDGIINSINAGYPVIATINNNNGLHEILIIGYKNGDRYVIVDPSSGRIKVIDGDKLSNLIKIEGYSVYNK